MVLSLLAVLALSGTGTVTGIVRIAPLPSAERREHHTHWDRQESIAGYALEIYRLPKSKTSFPVKEIPLDKSGKFNLQISPGRYFLTVHKDMNAGAYVDYPSATVRIRAKATTRVRLIVRAEYFLNLAASHIPKTSKGKRG